VFTTRSENMSEEGKTESTGTYVAGSAPMIHTPGVYKWSMAARGSTVNKEARTWGARMFLMAYLFPDLPSWVLLEVAKGKDGEGVNVEIQGEDVVITYRGRV